MAGEQLNRAGDRIRTDDNHVGNVVLYQLSYTRKIVTTRSIGNARSRVQSNHEDGRGNPHRTTNQRLYVECDGTQVPIMRRIVKTFQDEKLRLSECRL